MFPTRASDTDKPAKRAAEDRAREEKCYLRSTSPRGAMADKRTPRPASPAARHITRANRAKFAHMLAECGLGLPYTPQEQALRAA
jgi:hypothetical protein